MKAFGINLGHVSNLELEIECPLQEVVAILDGLGVTGISEDNAKLTVAWDVGISQMFFKCSFSKTAKKVYFFDRKKVGTFFHSLISRGSSCPPPLHPGTREEKWSARTRVKSL